MKKKTIFIGHKRYEVTVDLDGHFWYTIEVYRSRSRRESALHTGKWVGSVSSPINEGLARAFAKAQEAAEDFHARDFKPTRKTITVYAHQYFGSGTVGHHWCQTDDDLAALLSAQKWAFENAVRRKDGFHEWGHVNADEFGEKFPHTVVKSGACSGYDYIAPHLPAPAAPSRRVMRAAYAAGITKVSEVQGWWDQLSENHRKAV